MTTDPLHQALSRDATALLDDLAHGAWIPSADEQVLAEALARTGLKDGGLRTELRSAQEGVHGGRLVDLLSPAAPLAELTALSPETEAVLRELTRLLDAVADA